MVTEAAGHAIPRLRLPRIRRLAPSFITAGLSLPDVRRLSLVPRPVASTPGMTAVGAQPEDPLNLASPFPNGLPGLVECIGPIGTTWLRLDAVSVAAPPQHSRRCAFVGPPSSRLRSPAIWYQFNQYTPLVAEVGARSTGGAHPCRCSEIRTWRVHCDRDWPQTVIEKFLDRHPHCCLIRTKKGIHQCKEPSCIWQHLFWWSS